MKTSKNLNGESCSNRNVKALDLGKKNPRLLQQIRFWINDMLKFRTNKGARERLNNLSGYLENGFPIYVNTSYFSTLDEATFLMSQIIMSNGTSLQTFLSAKLTEKVSSSGEVCTSHHIAPLMYKEFHIQQSSFECNHFKKEYKEFEKEWKKKSKLIKRKKLNTTKLS
mmetsp:Transcript_25747/g.26173  ORF Transcript_25747/g.26173 Transcript_25747/m.26173 type:complete len:168 (-) Transcript_25747:23-526(-)